MIWSTSLDITNTANFQTNNQEVIFIDYESYLLRLDWMYGLADNWSLRVNAPFMVYSEGFLDKSIDGWHNLFGFREGIRPFIETNRFRIFYSRNNTAIIDITSPPSAPGDIQVSLGRQLIRSSDAALSLWTSIDLPTGSLAEFTSNDAADFALWIAADKKLSPEWFTDSNFGILFPGRNQLGTLEINNTIGFGYIGIQWRVLENTELRAQANGHTTIYSNSQLISLSKGYSFTVGARIYLDACSSLDLAVSEDLKVGATPDVSFLISWKHLDQNCQ